MLLLLYGIEQLLLVEIYANVFWVALRPVHLLRVSLLRVLEPIFPGDSLYNYTDMRIPIPEN